MRFALIGAGRMGLGLLHQACLSRAYLPVSVYDHSNTALQNARKLFKEYSLGDDVDLTTDPKQFQTSIASCDLLIDASTAIHETRPIIERFIAAGRHVFMMNSEADLLFGPEFLHAARRRGVVYSSVDGDQHGVLMRLVNSVQGLGLRPALLGNIKGFLDRRATPKSIAAEARKRNLDPAMCCSFTDGTKLAVEMALLANATNARVAVPGMKGPAMQDLTGVVRRMDLDRWWDGDRPIVDYVLGAQPDGGVFVIAHTDDCYQREYLKYYKMGDGPYYVFTRPYHLCHLEAFPAIADAISTGAPLVAPTHGRKVDVFARAKRALARGETIDGLGGAMCYGLAVNVDEASYPQQLPICLSGGARLLVDIAPDEPVHFDDVVLSPETTGAMVEAFA